MTKQREPGQGKYADHRKPGSNVGILPRFLTDPDESVRFLAVKWIADEKLADYRDDITKAMNDPKLSVRMYVAYATALARLDGKDVNERSLATTSSNSSPMTRRRRRSARCWCGWCR